MNNLQFSSFKKKILQIVLFIVALCVVSAITYGTTELFAAQGPLSAEIEKHSDQILKVASKVDVVEVEEETLEKNTEQPEKSKELISHELTHVNQSKAAQDNKHKRPARRPEYTDINTHDPGIADEKHEKWIDVLSMSSPAAKKSEAKPDTNTSIAVEREMKESGEKGGTTDMNIGIGELQEVTLAKSMDKAILRKRPGRTTYRGTKDSLKLTLPPIGYVCEGGGANDECFCDGTLDCHKLWLSGDCKKDSNWQDGNDSSKGGCTATD